MSPYHTRKERGTSVYLRAIAVLGMLSAAHERIELRLSSGLRTVVGFPAALICLSMPRKNGILLRLPFESCRLRSRDSQLKLENLLLRGAVQQAFCAN